MIAVVLVVAMLSASADLAELEKQLKSSNDRERQKAIEGLGALATTDAWKLLLGALRDPSSRVADEAEIQLRKLDSPALLSELATIAIGTDARAVHAAGALADSVCEQAFLPAYTTALQSKSDDVRAILLAGIERIARSGRFGVDPEGVLAKKVQAQIKGDGKGGDVSAAALLALGALQPAAVDAWIAKADAGLSAPHLCALLRVADERGGDARSKLLTLGASHAERAVRAQAVELVAAEPDAAGIKLLASMLATESNRRLFWRIDSTLERLSGLAGGGKPDFWKAWSEKLGPEWQPVTGGAERGAPTTGGDTAAPKLVGMPILSERIAILVDFSGSTWEKRADGRTAKDRLDEELKKALEALAPTTRFNVIPYTDTPIPWEKKLQPATPQNVKKALDFFTGCKATGKGDAWGAIERALQDPDVDTLLVLTDGAPTGGIRWNLDLMRARYLERDRFRHVVLDAVLVGAKKPLQDRWDRWCRDTGGRMLAVEL